jgi:adenylate cyclase
MELLDIEGDAQVWGQQYTKKLTDIFVLQDEIVDEVLQALKLKLAGEPKKRSARPTQSTEAYQLYLKGRFLWSKRTPDGIRKAIELYEKAIDKDPKYALAYAGLSDCWTVLGATLGMKPSEAFPRARVGRREGARLRRVPI